MSALVEGTFTLDGLLEGRSADGGEAALREFVELLSSLGLRLDLQLEGDRFSLLAESTRTTTNALGPDPQAQVGEALEQLVALVGPASENEIFSTLRSVEIRPDTQVRSVYVVRADDGVDVQTERVVAETTPPRAPPSGAVLARRAVLGLLGLLALVGLTSLFVPLDELFASVVNHVAPLDPDGVEVDLGALGAWLAVDGVEVGARSQSLRITLRRSDAWPEQRAALDGEGPAGRAMAAGYLRAEVFTADGTFLGHTAARIKALDDHETTVVVVPVPRDPRPARIALVP